MTYNHNMIIVSRTGRTFMAFVSGVNPRQRWYLITMALAGAAMMAALTLSIIQLHRQRHFSSVELGSSKLVSTAKPSAKQVSSYQVPPNLPKYIEIPTIHLLARIYKINVDATGRIEAPDNIYDTGWYGSSSLPGQSGIMFIDGHTSYGANKAAFNDLKLLKAGAIITVVRGDNQIFNYSVKKMVTYDASAVDMAAVLAPVTPCGP